MVDQGPSRTTALFHMPFPFEFRASSAFISGHFICIQRGSPKEGNNWKRRNDDGVEGICRIAGGSLRAWSEACV